MCCVEGGLVQGINAMERFRYKFAMFFLNYDHIKHSSLPLPFHSLHSSSPPEHSYNYLNHLFINMLFSLSFAISLAVLFSPLVFADGLGRPTLSWSSSRREFCHEPSASGQFFIVAMAMGMDLPELLQPNSRLELQRNRHGGLQYPIRGL